MTNKTKAVLRGFTELSASEKREFIEEINKYLNESEIRKGYIDESLSNDVKRVLGPTSSDFCPCCGR